MKPIAGLRALSDVVTLLCCGHRTAMEVTPAVFVPQMLFSGFYIKMEQIPAFLRWIQVPLGDYAPIDSATLRR